MRRARPRTIEKVAKWIIGSKMDRLGPSKVEVMDKIYGVEIYGNEIYGIEIYGIEIYGWERHWDIGHKI